MYYEINVSLNDRHFFATHERSITDMNKLKNVCEVFAEKFPKSEGYEITISYCEKRGYRIDINDVLDGDKEE